MNRMVKLVLLLAVGTIMSLALAIELRERFPGIAREVRVPLSYLFLFLPFAIAFRNDPGAFGYRREHSGRAMFVGLGLGAAILIGAGRVPAIGTPALGPQLAALVPGGMVAAVEEGIFRGALQAEMVRLLGGWRGIVTTAAIFALWHVPVRLAEGLDTYQLVTGLVIVFAIGIALGALMRLARNAMAPAVVHTALNWIERL